MLSSEQVEFTLDPTLFRTIARSMYTMHNLPTIVRELMQNAQDACLRKPLPPKDWRVQIIVDATFKGYSVTCTDNGVGMTADQIKSDLLKLGKAKATPQAGQTGGFGLAKVAIASHGEWAVRSKDVLIDKSMALSSGHPMIDGTCVSVKDDIKVNDDNILATLAIVMLSGVDIDFKLTYNGTIIVDQPHAGFDQQPLLPRMGKGWSGFVVQKYGVGQWSLANKNVFRINGLVQWIDKTYDQRNDINCIVDIDVIGIPPQDDRYPLNGGRDKFRDSAYQMQSQIGDWLRKFSVDFMSSKIDIERAVRQEVPRWQEFGGRSVRPKKLNQTRNTVPEDEMASIESAKTLTGFRVSHYEYNAGAVPLGEVKPRQALLAAWAKMLFWVVNEPFGVGFTGDYCTASRTVHDGLVTYLINPEHFRGFDSADALANFLWHTACHEAAHAHCDMHDEGFTNMESEIAQRSAADLQIAKSQCLGLLANAKSGLR